jgi:hypothetical protein
MHETDFETIARNRRVQALCREMSQLLTVSLEQRRVNDQLLSRLEEVTRAAKARLRPPMRPTGASAGGTRPSK